MKNFFKSIFAAIVGFFKPTTHVVDIDGLEITPEEIQDTIDIVNNVKTALQSPIATIVTDLIPTRIDDTIRQVLVDNIPVVVAGLTYAKDMLQTSDKSAVLNALLAKVKFSDKPDQDALLHNLAARVLMIRTDGRINWTNAVLAVEYYFKYIFSTTKA